MALTPEQQQALKQHIDAAAAILYANTPPEQRQTLEGIELAVRAHFLETVGPQMALFLSRQAQAAQAATPDSSPPASAGSQSPKPRRTASRSKRTQG
jgi:hypothetical protein